MMQEQGKLSTWQRQNPSHIVSLKKLSRNINKNRKIKIDITKTEYTIIKIVALNCMNWILWSKQDQKDDANIFWVDTYITQEHLRKLKPYQKINHFPGSHQLGRKNNLAINLKKLRKKLPQVYNFFPETWVLPRELQDFKKQFIDITQDRAIATQYKDRYFIAKPEAGSQGRGILLFNKLEQIQNKEPLVVQTYIQHPLLIQDLKFDFRIYVLIKSLLPLKIFIYQEGLTRFATNNYEVPTKDNYLNQTMHLTNYAINKKSPNFVFNMSQKQDNVGHKRSFSSVISLLEKIGINVQIFQQEIDAIIVKTILSAYQPMTTTYKQCRPKQLQSICFQILGFDVMIDKNYKPYLIEVNHTPSFTTDTPLDYTIKKNLILDTLNILNISHAQKKEFLQNKEPIVEKISANQIKNILNDELEYENKHMGAYRRIYPPANTNIKLAKIYNIILKTIQENNINLNKKYIKLNSNIEQSEKISSTSRLKEKLFKAHPFWSKSEGKSMPLCLIESDLEQQQKEHLPSQNQFQLNRQKNITKINQNKILKDSNDKKKSKLEPIKLSNAEIGFFTGIYETYRKIKYPYFSHEKNSESVNKNSDSAYLQNHKKKSALFNFEKSSQIEKMESKTFISNLRETIYENTTRFQPIKNSNKASKVRLHKIKNMKNSTEKRSKEIEQEHQKYVNVAMNVSYYGNLL